MWLMGARGPVWGGARGPGAPAQAGRPALPLWLCRGRAMTPAHAMALPLQAPASPTTWLTAMASCWGTPTLACWRRPDGSSSRPRMRLRRWVGPVGACGGAAVMEGQGCRGAWWSGCWGCAPEGRGAQGVLAPPQAAGWACDVGRAGPLAIHDRGLLLPLGLFAMAQCPDSPPPFLLLPTGAGSPPRLQPSSDWALAGGWHRGAADDDAAGAGGPQCRCALRGGGLPRLHDPGAGGQLLSVSADWGGVGAAVGWRAWAAPV